VLSDFFDRYRGGPRKEPIEGVLAELNRPIAYTSLATAVGFASLMLVPIPPVRVFGLFVAIGVGLSWLLTMTFLPAFMVTVAERRLTNKNPVEKSHGWLPRFGAFVVHRRVIVLGAAVALVAVTAPGLASISVNDNPVRWFRADHEIRQASEHLGEALPGTFTASLVLTETEPGALDDPATRASVTALVDELEANDEVGAIQSYVEGDHPLLRNEDKANIRLQLRSHAYNLRRQPVTVFKPVRHQVMHLGRTHGA